MGSIIDELQKILLCLGDVVHTLPVISAIKEEYPDSKIGYVVEDRCADVIRNHPLIDKIYVIPRDEYKKSKLKLKAIFKYLKVLYQIHKEKYSIAIDMHRYFKTGLIMLVSGAKKELA